MQRIFSTLALLLLTFGAGQSASAATATNLTDNRDGVATQPSMSVSGSFTWVVWSEYDTPTDATTLWARRLDSGVAQAPFQIDAGVGRVLTPIVLAKPGGAAWFFWIRVSSAGGELMARQYTGRGLQTAPFPVTTERAAYPAATLDAAGQPWVFWESDIAATSHIRHATWNGSAFSAPTTVSQVGTASYDPAVVLDAAGEIWTVWQSHAGSNYDIFARRTSAGVFGATWQISQPYNAGGGHLGHHTTPAIARGALGNVWIGWVAKALDAAAFEQPYKYGQAQLRKLQVRYVTASGQLGTLRQVPVPTDSLFTHGNPRHRGPDSPRLTTFNGKLVVLYRLIDHTAANTFRWNVWQQHLAIGTQTWLEDPIQLVGQALAGTTHGYDEAVGLAVDGAEVLVARQQDNHARSLLNASDPLTSDIVLERLSVADIVGAAPTYIVGETPEVYNTPLDVYDDPRPAVDISYEGETFSLYRGDFHLHSTYSHDGASKDDLIRENYRRAHDVVGLDFVALTDHGHHQHLSDWDRHKNLCDLNQDLGGVTVFLGEEYTNQNYGHLNVIYEGCEGRLFSRRMDLHPEDLWGQLKDDGASALTIPHHTADEHHPTDLSVFDGTLDDDYVKVFEIYQARGSFECTSACADTCVSGTPPYPCESNRCTGVNPLCKGNPLDFCTLPPNPLTNLGYFQDSLARGQKMGVIASPDHGGYWGMIGVYARSKSRADLFEALKARRTFGLSNAASRMVLELRGDGHIMGEEYQLSSTCPTLNAVVETHYPGAVIDEVKIYRVGSAAPGEDGEVFAATPNQSTYTVQFTDSTCSQTGSAAYYLRARASGVPMASVHDWLEPSLAWTSPVFVTWGLSSEP